MDKSMAIVAKIVSIFDFFGYVPDFPKHDEEIQISITSPVFPMTKQL